MAKICGNFVQKTRIVHSDILPLAKQSALSQKQTDKTERLTTRLLKAIKCANRHTMICP